MIKLQKKMGISSGNQIFGAMPPRVMLMFSKSAISGVDDGEEYCWLLAVQPICRRLCWLPAPKTESTFFADA